MMFFFLPLSTEAHQELLLLQNHLEGIPYIESDSDSWSPIWGLRYTS